MGKFSGVVYLQKKPLGLWDVVPTSWLLAGDTLVQYPPSLREGIDEIAARRMEPDRDWPTHSVEVRCNSGKFE